MLVTTFIGSSLENIGNSFLFGSTTSLVSKIVQFKNDGLELSFPNKYKLKECIRTGGQFAKYSLIYSCNMLILSKFGVTGMVLNVSSAFFTSFYIGLRNGIFFATKSGVSNVIISFVRSLISL